MLLNKLTHSNFYIVRQSIAISHNQKVLEISDICYCTIFKLR